MSRSATAGRRDRRGRTGSDVRIIDATGKVVTPGFIDIHRTRRVGAHQLGARDTVHQGVTCVVAGNRGGASAPVWGSLPRSSTRHQALRPRADLTSFGEYARAVERSGTAITSLVCRPRDPADVRDGRRRSAPPRRARGDEGAACEPPWPTARSASTGLIYPPSAYGTTDEISALATVVHERDGPTRATSVTRATSCSRRSRRTSRSVAAWRARAASRITRPRRSATGQSEGVHRDDRARPGRRRGRDRRPVPSTRPSSTGLAVTIPKWAHAGGRSPSANG